MEKEIIDIQLEKIDSVKNCAQIVKFILNEFDYMYSYAWKNQLNIKSSVFKCYYLLKNKHCILTKETIYQTKHLI
jgi:hypothetical protein